MCNLAVKIKWGKMEREKKKAKTGVKNHIPPIFDM